MNSISPQDQRSIYAISWVCFFWSMSTLMVVSLMPVFLTEVLGASKQKLGSIEGFAIFLAFMFKVFAGVASDYLNKRKPLIILGSFLNLLIKPMFAFATNTWWVFAARILDRLNKGIRSSPTDALIADLSPNEFRGKSYGLKESLYNWGGVTGALMAWATLYFSNNNYRLTFILATLPAAMALLIVFLWVKPSESKPNKPLEKWRLADISKLPRKFWWLLAVAFILMHARFSEGFVSLQARAHGMQVAYIPFMMLGMYLMHAIIAYPMGKLADRMGRFYLLFWGIIVLIVANLVLIKLGNIYGSSLGALLAGIHLGMTHGLLATLVAESTLPHLRGTAFAMYHFCAGIALLIGNNIAGNLADLYGAAGPFFGGIGFSTAAALLLFFLLLTQKKYLCEESKS